MADLIQDIDEVLKGFIVGDISVGNYDEYMALERIAIILNKHRKGTDNSLEDVDFS